MKDDDTSIESATRPYLDPDGEDGHPRPARFNLHDVGPIVAKADAVLNDLQAAIEMSCEACQQFVTAALAHCPLLLPTVRRVPMPVSEVDLKVLRSPIPRLSRRIEVLSRLTGLRPTKVTRYLYHGRGTPIVGQRISAALATHGVDLLSLVPRVHCKYCGEGDPSTFPSCAATDTETHSLEPDWGQPR